MTSKPRGYRIELPPSDHILLTPLRENEESTLQLELSASLLKLSPLQVNILRNYLTNWLNYARPREGFAP
jgi:hypothetical protein